MSDRYPEKTPLERRAKAAFDADVSGLDGRTRSRLAQARHRALAQGRRAVPWRGLVGQRPLLPAGAAAAVLLAALVVWRMPSPNAPSPELAALQDLEILLGEEDLDMLEELDFYTWLEEQPEFAAPAAGDDSVG